LNGHKQESAATMLYAITTLFLCQLAGELLVQWLSLPIPGPLIGMLLLFIALLVRGGVPEALSETSSHLLRNLMLLFIPAVTGVMLHFERVGREWLPFLAAGIVGAAFTMTVTALTLRWMIRITGKEAE
jgi:holin-like protein